MTCKQLEQLTVLVWPQTLYNNNFVDLSEPKLDLRTWSSFYPYRLGLDIWCDGLYTYFMIIYNHALVVMYCSCSQNLMEVLLYLLMYSIGWQP